MNIYSVLIVDDEQDFAATLAKALELINPHFTYQIASNGLAALELLNKNEFDCIITDVRMPKLDGIAFAHKVREAGFNLPIIFISGEGGPALESKIKELGAVDFLLKPFDFESMNYVLLDVLEDVA